MASKKSKLTDLRLGEVSVVDRGSNGGSHIMLIKRHDDAMLDIDIDAVGKSAYQEWKAANPGKEISDMPGEVRKQDAGRITDLWLLIHPDATISDLPDVLKAETFDALMAARENEQDIWDKIYVLQDSLMSILRDENIEDKQAAAAESLLQFHQAMLGSITKMKDGGEPMDDLQKLQKAFDDLKALYDAAVLANTTLQEQVDAQAGNTDDGGIDKSALPEAVQKVLDDQATQLAAQGDVITKMQDEAMTAEFIAKAGKLNKLPVDTAVLGDIMKTAKKAFTDEQYTTFESMLNAAHEAQSNVFKELGSDGSDSGSALDQLNALAKTISEADGITIEKGFTEAMKRNPNLRDQYKVERRSGQPAQH